MLYNVYTAQQNESAIYIHISPPSWTFFPFRLPQCIKYRVPVKNLPVMRETWVRSLGWEDPLENGMAVHSSILAWRIPWTEEPGGLQRMGSQRVVQD